MTKTFMSVFTSNFYTIIIVLILNFNNAVSILHANFKRNEEIMQNYFFTSTVLSEVTPQYSRFKRSDDNCINLLLQTQDKKYNLCIKAFSASQSDIVNIATNIVVHRKISVDEYALDELNLTMAEGYVHSKPHTSSVYGYVVDYKFYGKIQIDSDIYYIEPTYKFANVHSHPHKNALVYKVRQNQSTEFYNNSNYYNPKYFIYDTPNSLTKRNSQARPPRSTINNIKIIGRVCPLLMLVDNSFFNIICNSDIKSSILTVLQSLREANSIFRSTDFDGDGLPDNIGFTVKYLIVLESEHSKYNHLPRYSDKPIDSRLYLLMLSRYDLLKEVCLGVAFTAQPFLSRILGLSYTALYQNLTIFEPYGVVGGICERPSTMDQGENRNSLAITYSLKDGNPVPQTITDLTLAHELGHSFGSDHDEKTGCYGHLMSPHTFNGSTRENYLFSSCSKAQIKKILNYKGHCLETDALPFCGNGLVEEGEDCDCGVSIDCIKYDACCTPKGSKGPPCKVNKAEGYKCHPSQGLCCQSNCQYRDLSNIGLNCTNFEKKCPCEGKRKHCSCGILGVCSKNECHSIECTRIGLKECKCPKNPSSGKCFTCCYDPSGKCVNSKFVTQTLVNNNHSLLETLKKISSSSDSTEKICVQSECVNLLFKTFNQDSFCLFKGQLGKCESDYVCKIEQIIRAKFPSIERFSANSFCACLMRIDFLIPIISSLLYILTI